MIMTDADIKAIGARRARWVEAINQANGVDFVSVLTDDAVWLPFGSDAINGKDRILSWLEKPFSSFEYDYRVMDVRIRVAGDWAVETATFETRARSKSGQEMPVHRGRYTMIWRRSDSAGWLIERYVDHSAVDVAG